MKQPHLLTSANIRKFYVDGAWSDPTALTLRDVVNPAREETIAQIPLGNAEDVDRAVAAAKAAFAGFARTTVAQRIDLLQRIFVAYNARREELAALITLEMGAPIKRTRDYMTETGARHFEEIIRVLQTRDLAESRGSTRILREPIGVCALITPWNAPITQVISKVAPALAAGCTMVLKPSELSPLNAVLLAEVMHEAGVPRGVFNLIQGSGQVVGEALSSHPDIDMISFTGSTRAGIRVATIASATVKRVHQELGGKSANIILPDADMDNAVAQGVKGCYANSGQSCVCPSQMLVPRRTYDRAVDVAVRTAIAMKSGDPFDEATELGPVVSRPQFDRVQEYISSGLSEGARLVAGGLGREINVGYFVRPTVFAGVSPAMTIAREEIFGPVLSILPYDTEAEAIQIANASEYGLASHIQSRDLDHAEAVAGQLRVGYVYLNYSAPEYSAPFGGYKRSGNGREYGEWGLEAYLEHKTIVGCRPLDPV